MPVLIDAHGPDHGLFVEVSNRRVTLRQWAECCEPDENGSYSPRIQTVDVDLATLFDKSARHYREVVSKTSMHDKIVSLALNYLGYWGGSEDHVDDSDCPCQHFCMNYSGIGKRREEPWPDHMKCDTCGGVPE